MPKNIQFRIDNPCHENWDRMIPEEQGRFCSSCSKIVMDFTGMSDQEILHWLAQPHEGSCGRLRQTQLNRALVPQPARKHTRLGWRNYLLAGLLLSSEVSAQTRPDSPPVTQYDSARSNDAIILGKVSSPHSLRPRKENLPDTLRGQVLDSSTGQSIPGAGIKTDRGREYRADSAGYFAIPRKALSAGHTLTISSIGYITTVIDIYKTWTDTQNKIIPIGLAEYMSTGLYYIVKPQSFAKKAAILVRDTLAFTGLTKNALTVYPNPVARGASITLSMRLDEPGTYVVRLSHPAMKKTYTRQVEIF